MKFAQQAANPDNRRKAIRTKDVEEDRETKVQVQCDVLISSLNAWLQLIKNGDEGKWKRKKSPP